MSNSEDDDITDFFREFGVDPNQSGFNAISREYKSNPGIENYVRLRRSFPEEEIEIATTGGIEYVFSEADNLRALDIDPNLVARCMDADPQAHSELSLRMLELVIARDYLKRGGATHIGRRNLAVSDVDVNYLIAGMLDSLSWKDELEISRDLIVLIKHQLRAFSSKFDDSQEKREKRHRARLAALQMIASGKQPSLRSIAKSLGVNATTVMRWFPDGNFGPDLSKLYQEIMELRKSDNGTEET